MAVVLLIEDDHDLAQLYRLQLEPEHTVMYAHEAQAAFDVLADNPVDVIVLDLLLPETNGVAILQELRGYGDWRRIPVIILSNLLPDEIGLSEKIQRQFGIKAVLEKMYLRPGDLNAAVNEVL